MKLNRDLALIAALLLVVCGIDPVIVWAAFLAFGHDLGIWHIAAVGLAMLVVAINGLLLLYALAPFNKKEEE